MINCVMVGIGGFIGSVCRYLIGLLPIEASGGFPVKTLSINVIGAFLIGLIAAWTMKDKGVNPQIVLMLKAGVCGGFTTFSTFAFESSELIRGGHPATAVAYILASVILGVCATVAAQLVIR